MVSAASPVLSARLKKPYSGRSGRRGSSWGWASEEGCAQSRGQRVHHRARRVSLPMVVWPSALLVLMPERRLSSSDDAEWEVSACLLPCRHGLART